MDTETLRQSLLALLTPEAHPLTAIRIDQILALHRIVTQLENALDGHPPLIHDSKRGPRLHPVLDALAKNRERLRRAVNDLERTLPKPQRPRKEDKGLQPLARQEEEAVNVSGTTAPPQTNQTTGNGPLPKHAAASSPSPPRGRGRGEGQPITGGPAPSTIPVGADLRVRPAPGTTAPPQTNATRGNCPLPAPTPDRADFLRLARAQLSAPINPQG